MHGFQINIPLQSQSGFYSIPPTFQHVIQAVDAAFLTQEQLLLQQAHFLSIQNTKTDIKL